MSLHAAVHLCFGFCITTKYLCELIGHLPFKQTTKESKFDENALDESQHFNFFFPFEYGRDYSTWITSGLKRARELKVHK